MGNSKSVTSAETKRSKRDLPTYPFLLKVGSYSSFASENLERYELAVFEAGGYKWRLAFYPRGKHNKNHYISVYLQIADTTQFFKNWELNVQFKLFIHDQIRDKNLVMEDTRCFNARKTEWGFEEFLPRSTFKDDANGYLVDDCCIFGAEIFVLKRLLGTIPVPKLPANGTFTWKIQKFSQLDKNNYYSDVFVVRGITWKLCMYPKGCSDGKGNSLSVFLRRTDYLYGSSTLLAYSRVYAAYTLRLKNHLQKADCEIRGENWFSSADGWGSNKFISLDKLTETSTNYIQDDTVILECEIKQLTFNDL